MNGDSEEPDLGQPIAQLAQVAEEPRQGFVGRIRGSIERRRLGSHMTGLAWHGVALIFIELVVMLATLLGGDAKSSDDQTPTA